MARVTLKLQVNRWRKRRLEPVLTRNMEQAMGFLLGEVRSLVDRPFPPASSPGEPPRKRTGDYQRSLEAVVGPSRSGKSITGRVGSNAPQARRLELGFVGIDSLGRNYNQAPRPHLRPALAQRKRKLGRMIARGGVG